jgi:hypothetical protein
MDHLLITANPPRIGIADREVSRREAADDFRRRRVSASGTWFCWR